MELEINGNKANLGNQIITLSRQVTNVIGQKLVDFSNRFTLPKDDINNRIFNSPYIVNSNNNNLDKLYKAKLIDQFILFNGSGKLNEVVDGYQFQIIEDSKVFFDDLNKGIKYLDFDSDDFVFNYTSYNTLKLPSSSVWVWPLISMHEDRDINKSPNPVTSNSDIAFYRPCFNWSVILNKIFTSRSWTVEYDSDIIDDLCLISNASKFYVTSYQKTFNETIALSGSSNLSNLDTNDFENNVTTTSTTIDIGDIKTAFRLRGGISVENQLTITIKATDGTGKVNEKKYAVNTTDSELDIKSSDFSTNDPSNEVEIVFTGSGNVVLSDMLLYSLIEEQELGDLSDNNITGYLVKAYDNLPNKTQKDIYKDTLTLTNSVAIPDSLNKKVIIKSLNAITKTNAIDWSEKFIQKTEQITNRFESFGQLNYLSYDNDDTVDESSGEASFEVNNESLED
ncbi:MAG: hypothetical protein R3250_05845, partial [Melioribacteraceae bacterium]|nr:hypothetical protein [Melioribacteraceae bacterium]